MCMHMHSGTNTHTQNRMNKILKQIFLSFKIANIQPTPLENIPDSNNYDLF